jgi:hypothetical protein
MSDENGVPSPEELANLYHAPEARVGPEARPRCLICGSIDGVYAGRCVTCLATETVHQAADERKEEKRRRNAHFYPEEQPAPEPPPSVYNPRGQEFRSRMQRQRQRDDEYHRALSQWAEGEEQKEHQERMKELARWRLEQQLQPVPPIPSLGAGPSMTGFYTVPGWQRWIHVVTEAAAVLAVPMLFSAARAAPEPHKTRLRCLAWGTLAVDGFLLYRWLTSSE